MGMSFMLILISVTFGGSNTGQSGIAQTSLGGYPGNQCQELAKQVNVVKEVSSAGRSVYTYAICVKTGEAR